METYHYLTLDAEIGAFLDKLIGRREQVIGQLSHLIWPHLTFWGGHVAAYKFEECQDRENHEMAGNFSAKYTSKFIREKKEDWILNAF